jgi:CheY-like chemotaxis protein
VVDDDRSFLATLRLMLRLCGFQNIVTAGDGTAALEHLGEWRFDLIVSDWNMPLMDGVDLLRRVRRHPPTARTPFILMTASLTEYAWRGAIEHGATEFLLKPFTLDALRSACDLCLGLDMDEGSNIIPLGERLRQRRYRV